jgi:mRNA interferase RelE/StbE
MPSYRIEFKRAARKALAMIHATHVERIRDSIDALAADPFPVGYRKLVGAEAKYRIRVGDYRVIYGVENQELVILVIRIGHRKEIYR